MKKIITYSALLALCIPFMSTARQILSEELLAALEPQNYSRGTVLLTQLSVFNQFKEADAQGSTKESCPYHSLRNGIWCAEAMLNQAQAAQHLSMIYNKNDMAQKLSPAGTWRTFISRLPKRTATDTDGLDVEETERLLIEAKDHGLLHGKDIDVAYFEHVNRTRVGHPQFEVLCALAQLQALKDKLDRKEDVTALVLVYADALQKPKRTGHWIALVVNSVGDKRQYVLMDSVNKSDRFSNDPTIHTLLEYLEGNTNPVKALPHTAVSPDARKANPLWGIYDGYLASYGKTRAHVPDPTSAALQGQPQSSYLFYGLITATLLTILYKVYANRTQENSTEKDDTTGTAAAR